MKPSQSRYWLNPTVDDDFDEQVATICEVYAEAAALAQVGVHVVSCDEKTGIQAVERKHPTQPMQPGRVERREFEYVRHGTRCLIAGMEVASGKILTPVVSETRKEGDFAAFIEQVIETDAAAGWVFVVDGLNTHQSETLVRLVAKRCEVEAELGVKGRTGILRSMPSRRAFLESADHRIRFVYTPKHCSWLNQVEIWFSILVRRVLKRGSFASVEDLTTRLLAFIGYFNRVLAKPFKWTYQGRPLIA